MKRCNFLLSIILAMGVLLILRCSTEAAEGKKAATRDKTAQILKKYPEADTDGDGVLSNSELRAFTRKLKQDRDTEPNKQLPEAVNVEGVAATYANVRYGTHERNLLDIWLAKSDKPTPLVIYIHGGGFTAGDKSKIYNSKDMPEFLNAGVSFATINYRYRNTDPLGVRGSLSDSKRALQFIRSKARDWNIDKTRIGAYGGSAGSGTATWLAFHDDMADPNNPDPVLRESTRLAVVGALATQATYDILQWEEILQMEPDPVSKDKQTPLILEFYGLKDVDELYGPKGKAIRAGLDMLGLMSSDDPPLYVYNGNTDPNPPKREDRGHMNHHPLHATALLKRARQVGLTAQVYAPALGIAPPKQEQKSLVEFFLEHLGATAAKRTTDSTS